MNNTLRESYEGKYVERSSDFQEKFEPREVFQKTVPHVYQVEGKGEREGRGVDSERFLRASLTKFIQSRCIG